MDDPIKNRNDLFRVMSVATSLAFGALAAIGVSMRTFGSGEGGFDFSWKSVVAFVFGAGTGWAFWHFVRRKVEIGDKKKAPPGRGPSR